MCWMCNYRNIFITGRWNLLKYILPLFFGGFWDLKDNNFYVLLPIAYFFSLLSLITKTHIYLWMESLENSRPTLNKHSVNK
jgi:hypothetical protein